ncbi:MAG TPA: hypothetical protein VN734_17310 [Acidobacteriaceae bacterium]|nr:hypothetical protein [Acidobacteriaceae bacterium]
MEGTVTKHQFAALSTRPVSQVDGDILALVASYGPLNREENYIHTVRGVTVEITRQSKIEHGKSYKLCVFPGWRFQWVNEGNIRSKRLARTVGELTHVGTQQRAA